MTLKPEHIVEELNRTPKLKRDLIMKMIISGSTTAQKSGFRVGAATGTMAATLACSACTSAVRAAVPTGASGAVPLLWSCLLNPDKLPSCAVAQDRSEK